MKGKVWFMAIVLISLLGLIIVGCAKAPTSGQVTQPIKLRFAMWCPETSSSYNLMAVPWKTAIEEKTNGRVEVTIFSSGALGQMQELYGNCRSGACDLFEFAIMPECEFSQMCVLSYLFPSATVASLVLNDLTKKYFQKYDYSDMKVLWMYSNAPSDCYGCNKKYIKTLEDRQGLKFYALSPLSVKGVKALGGSPVAMPFQEAYSALERGLLDVWGSDRGATWTFKFCYVTKYRTVTPAGGVILPMGVMMNKDKFNSLPADIQQIIEEESGQKWTAIAGQNLDREARDGWQKILEYDKKVGNPEPYYMTEDEMARWIKAYAPVKEEFMNELEAKGFPAREAMKELERLVEVYSQKYPSVRY